ncbi:MAG: hypothetical protein GKS04_05305 [Candidatus Mycalebacterium zealandia]|nr:MAG: hypothetical protein GKS04_05305 [Candidatus Mycalebacterium zealandia]
MRLIGRLGLFYKVLFIEAAILFLVGAVFYSQFSSAKSDVITKTVATSELIGNEAAEFAVHNINPTSAEFYSFLRTKHGSAGVFKTFNVVPSSFDVAFTKENFQGRQTRQLYSEERGYGVRDKGGVFTVSAPFLVGTDGNPYGVVTINSSKTLIMKQVLKDNLLLYIALLVVLNNQVFILHYFATKRQKEIIDKHYAKPYMKQHSVGALKVMRKILEEIIDDCPEEPKIIETAAEDSKDAEKTGSKKVISLSRFISRNS